jgi:L-ascorbate metabolism protein UlaG (beta-lactamase superfamily)
MNTVFLIKIGDVVVCHMGDLGAVPTSRLVAELNQAQVRLIPARVGCTLDVSQAMEVVQLTQPARDIPIHHQEPVSEQVLGSVYAFLKVIGTKQLQAVTRLSLSAASMPQDT